MLPNANELAFGSINLLKIRLRSSIKEPYILCIMTEINHFYKTSFLTEWSVLLEIKIAMDNLCLSVVKKLVVKG